MRRERKFLVIISVVACCLLAVFGLFNLHSEAAETPLIHGENIEISPGSVYDLTENSAASDVMNMKEGTIIIRFTRSGSNQYQSLFSVSNSTKGNENRHFHIYITPTGSLGMELRNTDSDFKYTQLATGVLNSDGENTIAFSANSSTGEYKLFANGKLVSTLKKDPYKFFQDISGLDTISLGGTIRGGAVKYPFGGTISSFDIYQELLDDETLTQRTGTQSEDVSLKLTDLSVSEGQPYDLSSNEQAAAIKNMKECTIIVRYTSTSDSSIQSLFSVSNSTSGNENRHFHIYVTPGGYLGFELRNTDSEFKYSSGRASSVRTYYDNARAENIVAFVADASSKTYKLFSNGELVSSLTEEDYKFISDITGLDKVSIGATIRGGTAKYTFGGTITDFEIYSTVYSDDDLKQITGKVTYGKLIFNDHDATNSNYFRIPSLLKLNSGKIAAAADARFGGTHDSKSNIDTVFSTSADSGETWSDPVFAYHFSDYADQRVDWPTEVGLRDLRISGSASFIDPSMVQDRSSGRLFLFVDVMPAGIGSSNALVGNGYKTIDGNQYLKLKKSTETDYNYSIREDGTIYDDSTGLATEYSVNSQYELLQNGEPLTVKQYNVNISGTTLKETAGNVDVPMNIFYKDSLFKVYPTAYLGMKYSDDEGKTWSSMTLLNTLKSDSEKLLITGPGVGIQIANGDYAGRLVVPIYSVTLHGFGVVYSDDHGASWKLSYADSSSSGATAEGQIVEMPDGSLKAYVRTSSSAVMERTSVDGGITWTSGTKLTQILATSYGTQISAIRYSGKIDGQDAVILSTADSTSGRNTGTIFVGLISDTGNTGTEKYSIDWKYSYKIDGAVGFSYSCLSELPDGEIGIYYEKYDSWSRNQLHLKNVMRFEKIPISLLTEQQ